ncbi:MAG: type II secretion system minor pseudopilin GspI, partial [Actinomycetota bacterium]
MRRGVTLLEVLVAAVLLSIGLLSVVEIIGGSAGSSRQVDDRTLALMAARSKMEEILKEPVLQTGTDQGMGVDTSTDYDWVAQIEPSSNPSLLVVTVL